MSLSTDITGERFHLSGSLGTIFTCLLIHLGSIVNILSGAALVHLVSMPAEAPLLLELLSTMEALMPPVLVSAGLVLSELLGVGE